MPPFRYTQEHLEFLSRHRALPRAELTAAFNAQFGLQKKQAVIAEICVKAGYLTGRTGCFKKGLTPHNKSMKGGYMKANRTSFKKGDAPHNRLPVGSERVDSKDRYLWLKIAEPDVWRPRHILAWEQQHGPVPDGYLVRFNDSNPLNSDPGNLSLVSRAEHLHLNARLRYSAAPAELKPSLRLLAKLEVRIAGRQRQTDREARP